MKRRGFLATIAGFFALKATTTLTAAPADACTTAVVGSITPDTPFVFLWEPVSLDEFSRRYLRPQMTQFANQIDANVWGIPMSMRLSEEQRRFDPARLPA